MAQHYCHQPRMLVQTRVFSHFQSDVFSRIKVRALILSPLSRVMGNVYVFSRIKDISSGAFWLCFRELDSLCAFPPQLLVLIS